MFKVPLEASLSNGPTSHSGNGPVHDPGSGMNPHIVIGVGSRFDGDGGGVHCPSTAARSTAYENEAPRRTPASKTTVKQIKCF